MVTDDAAAHNAQAHAIDAALEVVWQARYLQAARSTAPLIPDEPTAPFDLEALWRRLAPPARPRAPRPRAHYRHRRLISYAVALPLLVLVALLVLYGAGP